MSKKKKTRKTATPVLQTVTRTKQSKSDKIKILAWGASPQVITGFGVVMRKILCNLYRMYPGKYDVSMVGINHKGDFYDEFEITGGPENGRFRQWPAMQVGSTTVHMYGHHKFLSLLDQLDLKEFDLIFLFEDPFWVGGIIPGTNPQAIYIDVIRSKMAAKGAAHVPIVAYFPIDGIPNPKWLTNISKIDIPITYLNFGKDACIEAAPQLKDRIFTIPHGVDTNEFFPISEMEKKTFKRAMFGDEFVDKFMFLNVNRNQIRKLIPSTLIAFKRFQELTNNAAFIYLNMKPVESTGWNLFECCNSLGLTPGVDVMVPPQFEVSKGLPLNELNKAFSSADALVSTAVGGGWELAVTQAFATKTVVIAPNNTSHTELLGNQEDENERRGLLYKSGEKLSQQIIFTSDNSVVRPLPDLDDMVDKMLLIYNNKELRNKLQENAYTWAVNNISWEKDVVPKFDYFFTVAKRNKIARENKAKLINTTSTTS